MEEIQCAFYLYLCSTYQIHLYRNLKPGRHAFQHTYAHAIKRKFPFNGKWCQERRQGFLLSLPRHYVFQTKTFWFKAIPCMKICSIKQKQSLTSPTIFFYQVINNPFVIYWWDSERVPWDCGTLSTELADVTLIGFNSTRKPVSPRTPLLTIN